MSRQRLDVYLREMSDQEVANRYYKETLKLKTLNKFGRKSARFMGHPSTLMMNLCRGELERRGLPIPQVSPPSSAYLSLYNEEGSELWEVRLIAAGKLSLTPLGDPGRPVVFDALLC